MPVPTIDFHCHPQFKSYGHSFDLQPIGRNTTDAGQRNSVWHHHAPSLADRAIHLTTGVLKFNQADMTSLAKGNVRIVGASLYPFERGLFNTRLGDGVVSDLASDFVTSVGKARIDYIQGNNNYFEDLCREYDYYLQLSGQPVQTDGGTCRYQMVKGFEAIDSHLAAHPDDSKTIFVVPTIEGMHSLIADVDAAPDVPSLMANVAAIKQWDYPPLYVTFVHHFYNHLCGHAKSMLGVAGKVIDQTNHIDTGFTAVGEEVLHALLSKVNGRRIYIDIKHMSALSRRRYFEILATDYRDEPIPVIASHASSNGWRSMDERVFDMVDIAHKLLQEDLNFFDNEIVALAKTGGLYCLQLDERRMASPDAFKAIRHSAHIEKVRYYRAELLWNQVQHVVDLLDHHGLSAWDCLAIGSDYDGIINPPNGYLTSETFRLLQENLEKYAIDYMRGKGKQLKAFNRISPVEIVGRIFYDNAFAFLKKWF